MQPRHRQSGVAALSLILLVLAGGSFVLLKALNVAAAKRERNEDAATYAALKSAKRLLIGYAANSPAMTDAVATADMIGPGRLPCPDLNGDGAAAGTCSLGGANPMTGRFPFKEIRSDKLVDGTGAALWYSLDEFYRYHLANSIINSDAPDGTLNVDAEDDIVAVIIAPGAALEGQSRSAGAGIGDYLEKDNANLDLSFTRFAGGDPFNDRIITVTRAELIAAAEHRALAEVRRVLNNYHERYGGFPWPSNFAGGWVGDYTQSIGAEAGHLALHVDREGITDTFAAPFTLTWDIPVDGAVTLGAGPQEACARSDQCNDDDPDIAYDFAGTTLAFTGGTCVWTNAETFECSGTDTVSVTVATGANLQRTYTVDIHITGLAPTGIIAPTSTSGRARELEITEGTLPDGSNITITVADLLDGVARGSPRTLVLAPGNNLAHLALRGVPFLIGDDRNVVASAASSPASLPRWFTRNGWQQFIYYAFASAEKAGGSGCIAGADCLVVDWDRPGALSDSTIDKARGVVLASGPALGTTRPSANLVDYFEGENSNADEKFIQAPPTTLANDQLQILDPGTMP